jgi:hypothetical protein
MTEIKEREPIVVNPLAVGSSVEQIDAVVGRIVADAIHHIENEAARALRQREVTRAVNTLFTTYGILETYVGKVVSNPHMANALGVLLDAEEVQVVQQLQVLNPDADLAKLQAMAKETVDSFRQRFGDPPKAKKSKSS